MGYPGRKAADNSDALAGSRRVDCVAAGHSPHDFNVLDFLLIYRVRIVRENDEVCEFPGGDRPLDGLLVGGVSPVDGVDPQRLRDADPLACDHSLDAHQRGKRPRAEVRARRRRNAGNGERVIVLLSYKLRRPRCTAAAPQQGQRGKRVTIAAMSLRRMVAIEFGMCRSGRKGGSSGSVTVGYGKLREQSGGTRS